MSKNKYKDLIGLAKGATIFAHPKLSGYHVGASVLGTNGKYSTGYNVETDIHHAIHAEMSAIHGMKKQKN